MSRPLISAIINNHNYAAFVGIAVESALMQQGQGGVEVIVVDDGSTDGSREVLAEYRDRAIVLLKDNGGQASALNAGVRASSGEILCFLDADDFWAPSKLARVAAAFRAGKDLSLVYHRLQPVQADGTPTRKPIPRSLCSGDLRRRMSRSAGWWPFPMTSAVAVPRSAWDAAGDVPESFRISADAWLVGIYPFLGRVAAIPEALGSYRLHQNNWYRKVDDEPMLRKRMAHWVATVEATNAFLAGHGSTDRLSLDAHFPYRAAAARLTGVSHADRLRLATLGLSFRGEPNLFRRARDVARLMSDLSEQTVSDRSPRTSSSGHS